MRFKLSGMISMKDNYSAVMQTAAKKTSSFKKEVAEAASTLDEMQKANKKMKLDIKTAAIERKLSNVTKKLQPLRSKVVTVLAYKDHLTKRIKAANSKLRAMVARPFKPLIALKDNVTAKLSALRSRFGSLIRYVRNGAALMGLALAGAFAAGAKGAMDLEQQQVSMRHFIGVTNPNMSEADVARQAEDYTGWLRKNANVTPFATSEVLAAGSRAVQISQGDTGAAQQLVELAENMAALTPGKTIGQAMEALADAQMGEMERLKEFGFKAGQEEFKAAGGDVLKLAGKNGQVMSKFFEGGAAKLAKTSAGKLSTIKGTMQTILVDGLGKPIMEALSGPLGTMADWLVDNQPKITAATQRIADGIIGVKDKALALKDKWAPTFAEIGAKLQFAWDKFLRPILGMTWKMLNLVKVVAIKVWDVVGPIFEKMYEALKPILEGLGKLADWVGTKADALSDWIENGGGKGGARVSAAGFGTHAAGLPYVPYDNYPALLHRGERVLTADDNRQGRGRGAAISITIPKLADTVNASSPGDVDALLDRLEDRLLEAAYNMGNVGGAY